MKRALLSSVVVSVVSVVSASSALAQTSPDTPPPAAPPPAEAPSASSDGPPILPVEVKRPRYDLIRLNVGLRVGHQPAALSGEGPSRGFDAFAQDDVLAQLSIDATYPIFTRGRLVLGAGLGWDAGGRSSTVRGFTSSLGTHRLYVPIEGRYHVGSGLFVFGKIAPGAVAMLASVSEGSSPKELSGTAWAFSADASVGGSILLGPRKDMHKRAVRFWLTPEVGYAYTTSASVSLNPGRADNDVLGSDEDAQLGTLALRGIFWRASVGMTF